MHQPESRGFDPGEKYLVRGSNPADGVQTHIFDGGSHEVQIPPKDGRTRVVMFGGSNTKLLPGEFLQLLLDQRGAPQQYEVINLGRHGYGSARERLLFDQATVLQPDVVFIYSGHNEFVEEQFRSTVAATKDDWTRKAIESLRQLKTVDLLASEVKHTAKEAEPGGAAAADTDAFAQYFTTFTPADRDRIYDAFRENLTAMCRQGREHGARVIVGTSVRNMFYTPILSKTGLRPDGPEQVLFDKLWEQAVARIPARFTDGVLPHIDVAVYDWGLQTGQWWEEFYKPAAAGPLAAPAFPQPSADALATVAQLSKSWTKVPLAEGALWTPPALWSRRTRRLLDTMSAVHEARLTPAEKESLDGAAERLGRAVKLAPEHAGAHFLLALCLSLTGGDEQRVAQLLDEAGDLDWAPIGANGRINTIIRDVAHAVDGVELLDADALFRARAPDGIIDYQIIMDANHLQPGARLLLLDDLTKLLLGEAPGGDAGDARHVGRAEQR